MSRSFPVGGLHAWTFPPPHSVAPFPVPEARDDDDVGSVATPGDVSESVFPQGIPGTETVPAGVFLVAPDGGKSLTQTAAAGFSVPVLFRDAIPVPPLVVRSDTDRVNEFCAELNGRLDAFLVSCGDRAREDAAVLFFWDLGARLGEMRRELWGTPAREEFYEAVSRSILNDNRHVADSLKALGFDVAAFCSAPSLADMRRLSCVFPRAYLERILPTVAICSGSLWAHIRLLASFDDPFERIYYAESCRLFKWNLTKLRHHAALDRFRTHTAFRQPDELQKSILARMAGGDLEELLYRDLLRFDFLDLDDETFKRLDETEVEERMVSCIKQVTEELGEAFAFSSTQVTRPYRDADGNDREIRLDILGRVNDGKESYPFVVELKKVPFSEAVLKQCLKYKHVMKGRDDEGRPIAPGYLQPNESRVLVMALVPKFNRDFEKIMEVGLRGDGRRSSIFVSLYSYRKPPKEFLEQALAGQIKASAARAARERVRLQRLESALPEDRDFDPDGLYALFAAIVSGAKPGAPEDGSKDKPPQESDLPF